ncbi:MAG: GGDEF domain-containing protein [Oleiphilaceae bacterium]|nr:GGDEF domain-containing protein [Oleiphilaceae bacterium]
MPLIRGRNAPISNTLTRFIPLPYLRALYGLLLSLGAPIGWIVVQFFAGRNPFTEQYFDTLLYAYMSIATAIVFSLLGFVIGRREYLITQMALRDSLTGLFNKRYFKSRLEQEIARHQRYNHPLSLIQIDLDHFKDVNDTYGHEGGDATLKHVAQILMDNCRKNEIAARVGGEELCVLATECDAEAAMAMAERLRQHIERANVSWQQHVIPVNASFGVACAKHTHDDWHSLYRAADTALYRAKAEGRNCVRLAREEDFNDESEAPYIPSS